MSNYLPRHLDELLSTAEIPPAVDRVEFHPFLLLQEILNYWGEREIQLEAYSPLAKAHRR